MPAHWLRIDLNDAFQMAGKVLREIGTPEKLESRLTI